MRLAVLAIFLLLGACSREPGFDERYQAAEQRIRKTAKDIDSEIGRRGQARQTGVPAATASEVPERATVLD